jgi:hypothetical protein
MRRKLDRIRPDRVYWHSRKEAAGYYESISMMLAALIGSRATNLRWSRHVRFISQEATKSLCRTKRRNGSTASYRARVETSVTQQETRLSAGIKFYLH